MNPGRPVVRWCARPCQERLGRKTDVNDATGLAELMAHGLIRGSFAPAAGVQELCTLLRWGRQRRWRTNWGEKASELTEGRGVDCVVEIDGPGTIAMSLKALAVGGHVSLIGASLSSSGTGLDPLLLAGRGITLGSISLCSRTDFDAMNRAIEMHRRRPVIDRTFPFAKAKEAYRHFEGCGHFGKVVITHRSLSAHSS
jgi:NADPH:quinone reductase-like Zn-dependent oxidoreductase